MVISERAEAAFLDYVLTLARKEAPSQVRQDESDETPKKAPEGASQKG